MVDRGGGAHDAEPGDRRRDACPLDGPVLGLEQPLGQQRHDDDGARPDHGDDRGGGSLEGEVEQHGRGEVEHGGEEEQVPAVE